MKQRISSGKNSEQALRHEIGSKLRQVIMSQGLTRTEVARRLGVTRQALSLYLTGQSMPSAHVLMNACRAFGLVVHYEGSEFGMNNLDSRPRRATPLQISLFDALEELTDENLEVKIHRKAAGRLEVQLGIKFSVG